MFHQVILLLEGQIKNNSFRKLHSHLSWFYHNVLALYYQTFHKYLWYLSENVEMILFIQDNLFLFADPLTRFFLFVKLSNFISKWLICPLSRKIDVSSLLQAGLLIIKNKQTVGLKLPNLTA